MVVVFTDGSCVDNGTPTAEGGIGVYFPFGDYHNISTHYDAQLCDGEPVTN
jgi:ribonuclease HI